MRCMLEGEDWRSSLVQTGRREEEETVTKREREAELRRECPAGEKLEYWRRWTGKEGLRWNTR